jgi:serine/threonine-protein kinase
VRVFDHGHDQGRYYLAMEFLEGKSCGARLRKSGALPLLEALRIASAVAEALEFAHRHGVIHCNVKPDHVHLEPDGRVVLTGFGIARLTFEPSLDGEGQILGTPSYMSPEQIIAKTIDKRTDLFSLGISLYEMIGGRKPFTGDSVVTITYNIINMELPPLPGAPVGVDQIIRRATAKDPSLRYRNAAEMAEDMRSVAQGSTPRHASDLVRDAGFMI